MTKTNDLRQYLFQVLFRNLNRNSRPVPSDGEVNNMVGQILAACQEAGLAFVVKDAEVPQLVLQQDTDTIDEKFIFGYRHAQKVMLEKKWKQVEEIEV